MTRDEEYEIARQLFFRAEQYVALLSLKAPNVILANQRGMLRETIAKMPPVDEDEILMREQALRPDQQALPFDDPIEHLDFPIGEGNAELQ